jgi:predicted component of type VI protein secretion system
MYELQLFDASDMSQPIHARLFSEGSLTIGRDPRANWPINDPTCVLSRNHCELFAGPQGLSMVVSGANGVYLGEEGGRLPDGSEIVLPLPCTLKLGNFRLIANAVAPEQLGMAYEALSGDTGGAARGSDAGGPPFATERGALLEAFCQGAGLDSSLLSDDEPEEIMRRAGAIYREVVIGISDLMAERNNARSRYEMKRTTIGGRENNPFKWSPSRRLALDLLLSGPSSFLPGPEAVRSSFRDLKSHLVASAAGMKDTMRAVLKAFSPEELDQAVPEKSSFLKNRAADQMDEVSRRYSDLREQIEDGREGSLDRTFMRSYDAAEYAARAAQQ